MTGTPEQEKRWRVLRNTGRPTLMKFEDPEVQALARKLRIYHARGMSYADMASQAGVAKAVPAKLANPEPRGVLRSTVTKLNSLKFEEPRDLGARIPIHGAQRRLRALRADGFTYRCICTEMGLISTTPWIQRIITGEHPNGKKVEFIYAYKSRQISQLYDRLQGVSPEKFGITPAGVKYSQRRAAANGWAPSRCWDPDTLDDPEAFPEWTGACGTPEGAQVHRRIDVPVCEPCHKAGDDSWTDRFSPDKFRAIRVRRGFTYSALGRAAGMSSSTISFWEAGKGNPTHPYIDRVMSALDCVLEEICDD